MKLKFDSNLEYQLNAIQGVADLFEGLPRNREGFETKTSQEQDRMLGRRPIEYVQATRPILIIDEPQSVDNTPKSQKAISNLNPLFALRYSATHTNPHNLLYQLDPIRAYDMRIVKQIEVVDARGGQDFNKTMVRLDAVGYWPKTAKTPQAKVTIFEDTPNGPREKQIKVKHGTDLAQQTNRPDYEVLDTAGLPAAGYTSSAMNSPCRIFWRFSSGKRN